MILGLVCLMNEVPLDPFEGPCLGSNCGDLGMSKSAPGIDFGVCLMKNDFDERVLSEKPCRVRRQSATMAAQIDKRAD